MKSVNGLREFTEFMAKSLVVKPDAVSVKEIRGGSTYILELRVAREDFGRILGKRGRIADAMRTLLIALAGKTGRRVTLELVP